MGYINTTFAHGNGPYSRAVEWAIEVNNVKSEKGLDRLPIIVPLVYPDRQERIMKEEIKNNVSSYFLEKHPDEIWLDKIQGELLNRLMFKGKAYAENLKLLAREYYAVEADMQRHFDGERQVENLFGRVYKIDLRDAQFQLGLNNRIQTGLPNQFYTAGGAGPFDELLERAIVDDEINLDKEAIKSVLPIAKRMIENQEIIFSNEPGVFSYDENRIKRYNEIFTPPFIHFPKSDDTKLPKKGIYLLMTGIDGIRETGLYNAISELDIQIYAPIFSIENLPDSIRERVMPLTPNKINNPSIVAQYARAGWSSIWLSHMAKKGFITPTYREGDDPEILFNERVIEKFGLGAIIEENPMFALKKSIKLAENVEDYNKKLILDYGTLDGIKYSAEIVVNYLEKRK